MKKKIEQKVEKFVKLHRRTIVFRGRARRLRGNNRCRIDFDTYCLRRGRSVAVAFALVER